MNTKKLDELTFIDGRTINKAYFRIFTLTYLILTIIAFFIGFNDSSNVDLKMISVGVIMSMVIVSLSITSNLFSKIYYQQARYYQIPLLDIYKYYMKRVFALTNIFAIVIIVFIGDIAFLAFNLSNFLEYFLPTITSSLILFTLTSIGFLSSTILKKPSWPKKSLIVFIMYIIAVATSVTVMIASNLYVVLIAFTVFNCITYYLTKLLLKSISKRMEV